MKITKIGAFLMVFMCLISVSFAYDNYSFDHSKYSIKETALGKEITLNLNKDINLSNLPLKENIFFNMTLIKYFGDLDIRLYEKLIVPVNYTNYYNCNCSNITYPNSTIENICNICSNISVRYEQTLKEINLSNLRNFIIRKNATYIEIAKVKSYQNLTEISKQYQDATEGKAQLGYSVYSDINILGLNIPNMTWYNTTYFNRYPYTLSNNGTNRTNELVFLDITGVKTNNANKTDLILVYNDTTPISYQFMNNKTEIVFLLNSSNATIYGYSVYSNASVTSWQNTTILNVYSNGEFENGEGYINDSDLNGINGWVTDKSCTNLAITSSFKLNTTMKFRGSSSLSQKGSATGQSGYNDKFLSTSNVVYFSYYVSKSALDAQNVIGINFKADGKRTLRTELNYNTLRLGAESGTVFSYNGTNSLNTWAVFNVHAVSDGVSDLQMENSTGTFFYLYGIGPHTSMTNFSYPLCVQQAAAAAPYLFMDNVFASTIPFNQYLNYTYGVMGTPESLESPPVVTFVSQNPPNFTIQTLFSTRLNISYNIVDTDSTPVINSTVQLYYKTNDTLKDGTIYINGSLQLGYENVSYDNASGINYNFSLGDSKVYPATYNIEQQYMQQTPKLNYSLSGTNSYIFQQMINITNKTYNFIEFYALPPASASSINVWLCNSSQQQNIQTSPNCLLICQELNTAPYNHTHTIYSKHYVCPFKINGATNLTGTLKVVPTMYIYLRPSNNQAWQIEYITNTSRTNAVMHTSNNGAAYTQLSGTIDAHIHQFGDNETLYYYACANDTANTTGCSTVKSNSIDLIALPPTTPFVWSPNSSQTFYKNQSVLIAYTNATITDNSTLTHYNISLLDSGLGFLSTIIANNDLNISYSWNASLIANGYYHIRVEICNTNNLCTFGFSELFRLQNPFVMNPNRREILFAIKEIIVI